MLVRHGVVDSIEEAFQRFLAKGAPAYVASTGSVPKPIKQQILELAARSGALTSIAHPMTLGLAPAELDRLLDDYAIRLGGLTGVGDPTTRATTPTSKRGSSRWHDATTSCRRVVRTFTAHSSRGSRSGPDEGEAPVFPMKSSTNCDLAAPCKGCDSPQSQTAPHDRGRGEHNLDNGRKRSPKTSERREAKRRVPS